MSIPAIDFIGVVVYTVNSLFTINLHNFQEGDILECGEFDISLAVQAVRALFVEASSNQDCQRRAWEPAKFWLLQLARENPQEILCVHENPLPDKKSGGCSCNVYITTADKKIIYLGTILSKEKAEENFQWLQENFPEESARLQQRGPMAITRWWSMCAIPVDAHELTHESIWQGAQKYFREFAPELANVPAKWLPPEQNTSISRKIFREALLTATKQSKQKRIEITSNNF